MGSWADTFVASVVSGLAARTVPSDVEPMTAYMRHQLLFLGVKAPGQKAAVRAALEQAGRPVAGCCRTLEARGSQEPRWCSHPSSRSLVTVIPTTSAR